MSVSFASCDFIVQTKRFQLLTRSLTYTHSRNQITEVMKRQREQKIAKQKDTDFDKNNFLRNPKETENVHGKYSKKEKGFKIYLPEEQMQGQRLYRQSKEQLRETTSL